MLKHVIILFTLCSLTFANSSLMSLEANNGQDSVKKVWEMDKNDYFLLGLLTVNLNYLNVPDFKSFTQTGVMIGSRKNRSNIDEIIFGDNLALYFNLGQETTLGFSFTENTITYQNNVTDTVKYYTGTINLFSYNVNAELIARLPAVDRHATFGVALTFFNLGGTVSYISGGAYNKRMFGSVEPIPFCLQLYAKIKLKNATFGMGFSMNPYNFAEFRFGSKDLLGTNAGFVLNEAQFTKYSLNFYLHFQ